MPKAHSTYDVTPMQNGTFRAECLVDSPLCGWWTDCTTYDAAKALLVHHMRSEHSVININIVRAS